MNNATENTENMTSAWENASGSEKRFDQVISKFLILCCCIFAFIAANLIFYVDCILRCILENAKEMIIFSENVYRKQRMSLFPNAILLLIHN